MSAQIDAPKYTYLKRGVYYFVSGLSLALLVGCKTIEPLVLPEISDIKTVFPSNTTVYEKMPCSVGWKYKISTHPNIANPSEKKSFAADIGTWSRRCSKGRGYLGKKGLSIDAPRGTPVLAIADMVLVDALNRSSQQQCKVLNRSQVGRGCMRPFDDLSLTFRDIATGRTILYYHLMSKNPFVPGFGQGECEIPLNFQEERHKRYPSFCGGYAKKEVKKGEVIGFSGDAGHPHISLGILIAPDDPLYNGKAGYVDPANSFKWEMSPSKSDAYLYPFAEYEVVTEGS